MTPYRSHSDTIAVKREDYQALVGACEIAMLILRAPFGTYDGAQHEAAANVLQAALKVTLHA